MKKPAANAFIIAYLLLQVSLMATCYLRDAKFFGWQMFSRPTVYRVQIFAVGPDGLSYPLPEETLRALIPRRAYGHLGPWGRYRAGSRGRGFLLAELKRLSPYLCEKLRGDGIQGIRVILDHRSVLEKELTHQEFEHRCAGEA